MRLPIRPRSTRRPPAVARSIHSGLPLMPGLNIVEQVGRLLVDKSLDGKVFRVYTSTGSLASLDIFPTQQAAAERARQLQGMKEIPDVA